MGCAESKSTSTGPKKSKRKKKSEVDRSGDLSTDGFSSLSYDKSSFNNSRASTGSSKKKSKAAKDKKPSANTSADGNPLAVPAKSETDSSDRSHEKQIELPALEEPKSKESSKTTPTETDVEVVHQVAAATDPVELANPDALDTGNGESLLASSDRTSESIHEKMSIESDKPLPQESTEAKIEVAEIIRTKSDESNNDSENLNEESDTSSLLLINRAPKEMPKQGSKAATYKEGVVGKVAATGDAKTTSSMSSVQSGWFFMSSQSQDGMIYMNGLVEKQFDQEKQLMGGFFQPERSQLFQLGITAYLGADDAQGDYYLQSLETPSIELLLTFTSEVQRLEWFTTGGALDSVPFKNKRLVYQWFSELGSDIRPVKVSRKGQTPSIASGISGGSSAGRTNNSEKSIPKGSRPVEALNAKNLLLNDKLLKQVENRSQLSKKKKTVGRTNSSLSRSSVSQSSHSDSQVSSDSNNYRVVGAIAAERMSEHGSSVSDLLELEQERERFDQEEERRRMSNATDI